LVDVDGDRGDEPGDVVDDLDLPAVTVEQVVVGAAEQDAVR
jgi:hypothetical protein